MLIMSSSYHQSDSDSISTITFESSRCRERKQFKQLNDIPEQRFVSTSSRSSVKSWSNALEEKEAEIISLRKKIERLLDAHKKEILGMQQAHANTLQEKEAEILDMQQVHEVKMLDMLKLKLSNTSTSISCHCHCHCKGKSSSSPSQGNDNNSVSSQREVSVSKASEAEASAKQRPQNKTNKISWCKIKSEVSSCGRSMLSKIKIKASRRSIPKEVDVLNTSEVEILSNLTY